MNAAHIKRIASEVGFDACGVARADALTDEEYPLREWLRLGWHGDLNYMERNVEKRMDPRVLLPGARTVICLLRGYNPETPIAENTPKIARYAYGEDYHDIIRPMLYELRERLGISGKLCCDTVPISDKHWAARAGLGWIGRHTLLVTPDWGTWVNLGEIVTTEECDEYDDEHSGCLLANPCTHCNRCVDACPNGALAKEGAPMLDVRRCTAYHTIESHSTTLPQDLDTGGYVFGCDICQQACPYNHHPLKSRPIEQRSTAMLSSLAGMDDKSFADATRGTPLSRITHSQWLRNIGHATE